MDCITVWNDYTKNVNNPDLKHLCIPNQGEPAPQNSKTEGILIFLGRNTSCGVFENEIILEKYSRNKEEYKSWNSGTKNIGYKYES